MSAPRIVADLKKNTRETLRVGLDTYKGHDLVSVRAWAPNADGSALVPTKAGVVFRVDLLGDVIAALKKAQAEAAHV